MEGIGEMFDIQVGGETRRLNYYGLLIGHLLKGDKVKEIALNVINQFLDKPWPNKEENRTNRQKLR
jgi:predicted acylesterase/phospholipase RssA